MEKILAAVFGFVTFLLDVFLMRAIVKNGLFGRRQSSKWEKIKFLLILVGKICFLFAALAFGLGYFKFNAIEVVFGAGVALVFSSVYFGQLEKKSRQEKK